MPNKYRHYPDILRQPAGEILLAFSQGGDGLILTWQAFAWSGLSLLFAILLLPKALQPARFPSLAVATTLGVIGGFSQMLGLLRWVFVVPILARAYTAPAADAATRAATVMSFQVLHQFGGVLLGEHIGQAFTTLWMVLVSAALLRSPSFRPWLGWLGLSAAALYLLAQAELLATVIPGFPQVGPAGLAGSLLWLAWMAALGVFLLRSREGAATPVLSGSS